MKLRKIIFTFAVLIFSRGNLFSQSEINLNLLKPDKVAVLGGNVLSKPIETSYGYAVISEGKLISAFNHDGTILWQRSFSSKLNPYISTGLSDMIYVVSKNNNINLLNPGGMILWTSKCGFDIIENPLPGKDGRVFLRGKENIACYGLNGICRWNINIEKQDTSIPLTELNDGSFLYAYKESLIQVVFWFKKFDVVFRTLSDDDFAFSSFTLLSTGITAILLKNNDPILVLNNSFLPSTCTTLFGVYNILPASN
jgi:hypothetical protein